MQHTNFHKKEGWIGNGHETCKKQQIEMIKRHYPDYVIDRDFVLWIVSDFFYPYKAMIQGQVQITKSNGKEIEILQVTRKPYPNKKIQQISMKSGRKRLYGIPLVFHSFQELCEVKEVLIRWDIFSPIYLRENEMPLDLNVKNVVVRYKLKFEMDSIHEEYHFFTVHSYDYVLEAFDDDTDDRYKQYYKEFDLAFNMSGVCEMEKDEMRILPSMISNIYDLTGFIEKEKSCITNKDMEVFAYLSKLKQDYEMIRRNLQEVSIKDEIQWDGYYYERAEVLTATSIADIVPEPSFGFKNI